MLERFREQFHTIKKVFADGGYRGELIDIVKAKCSMILEIVLRTDKDEKFKVLPERWIVERTFAWFGNYRRLRKDFEFQSDTSEAMLQLEMINFMLKKIYK